MIDLKNICLLSISSNRIAQTQKALEICLRDCVFKDVLFFTDDIQQITNKDITPIQIDKLNSIKDYDYFVLKTLPHLITQKADYYLTIHWDGFIVKPNSWSSDFLNYDYIGAPWPWFNFICGNGGFCLKSQKFIETQINIMNELDHTKPDDVALCILARQKFIDHGCVFALPNIAYKFSTEYGDYKQFNSFGFHDFKYHKQFKGMIKND